MCSLKSSVLLVGWGVCALKRRVLLVRRGVCALNRGVLPVPRSPASLLATLCGWLELRLLCKPVRPVRVTRSGIIRLVIRLLAAYQFRIAFLDRVVQMTSGTLIDSLARVLIELGLLGRRHPYE